MTPRLALLAAVAAVALASGCSATPAPEPPVRGLAIPVRDLAPRPLDDDDPREAPPEPDAERPRPSPAVTWERHASGLQLAVAQQKGAPTVELRLVVLGAGERDEGASPGLARLALRLAVEGGAGRHGGREFSEKLASLAGPWALRVVPGAALLSLSTPKERLGEVIELLGLALREPRLDAAELARVRRVERGVALGEASRPAQQAAAALRRETFKAALRPSAAEIDHVALADIKAFVKQRYVPASLALVLVGDVDPASLKAPLDRVTASWKGAAPAPAAPETLPRPERHRLLVIDSPGHPFAEIFWGSLGPARGSDDWAPSALLAELLGGAPSARLGSALRDVHPLGHTARVELLDLGAGPGLFQGRVSVDPAKLPAAFGALLDEIKKSGEAAATEADLQGARRRALAALGRRQASPPELADLLAQHGAAGQPGEAFSRLGARLKAADGAAVQKASREHLGALVVVVVGDAARVATPLSRWGEVAVLGAEKLDRIRVLPEAPPAPEPKK